MARKIGIIGLGHVGVTCAYGIVNQGLADELVLIDTKEKKVKAEVFDLKDALVRLDRHVEVTGMDYAALKDADLVITAFGDIKASVESGDRFAELPINLRNAEQVGAKLKEVGFTGILLNISNPCDAVTTVLRQSVGLPTNQVFGTGTFLDTARMLRAVAEANHQSPKNIAGYVLGEHGNSQFTAWSTVKVGQEPIVASVDQAGLDHMEETAKNGAWAVAAGKGYTSYAIATCAIRLAEAVFSNEHLLAPVSAYVPDYGVYVGYPALIGKAGVEDIVKPILTEAEEKKLADSANIIKGHLDRAAIAN